MLDKYKRTHKRTYASIVNLYKNNPTLTIKECIAAIQWQKRVHVPAAVRGEFYKEFKREIDNKF